jgi:Kef-type K+ transport system membrane component KefB
VINFDNLVAVLAVAAAVPLILTAGPLVRVPGPVLEIVAGIVLGPGAQSSIRAAHPRDGELGSFSREFARG